MSLYVEDTDKRGVVLVLYILANTMRLGAENLTSV